MDSKKGNIMNKKERKRERKKERKNSNCSWRHLGKRNEREKIVKERKKEILWERKKERKKYYEKERKKERKKY